MKKILNPIVLVALVLNLVLGAMPLAAAEASGKGVVNINTADAEAIARLPRIGLKAAERIVSYRKENGPFKKTTDLMQVKGVGDKTYELISPYLTVSGETTLMTNVASPRKPRAAKASSSRQPTSSAQ